MEYLPHIIIKKIKTTINIRGIGSLKHVTDEYCLINLYVPSIVKGKPSLAHLRREVHIVDDLKAKILMGVNILGPERILIDVGEEKLLIRSCDNLTADIKVKAKDNVKVRRHIRNQKKMVLLFNTMTRLSIELRTSTPLPNRDYLFELSYLGVYAYIVDANISFICVKNNTDSAIIIPRYAGLGILVEYNAEYYYTAYPD